MNEVETNGDVNSGSEMKKIERRLAVSLHNWNKKGLL
jgi:hypothetical protein